MVKSSQIFILQRIDRIVLFDLIHGIQHRDKHDQKHAADGDGDAVPRNVKAAVNGLDVDPPDDPGHGQRGREAPDKPLDAVDDALIIHHPPEAPIPESDGAQHGKLSPPQGYVRRDGVEHIRDRDE